MNVEKLKHVWDNDPSEEGLEIQITCGLFDRAEKASEMHDR